MSESSLLVMTESKRLLNLYIKHMNNNGIKINCDHSLSVNRNCKKINNEIYKNFKKKFKGNNIKEEIKYFIDEMDRLCLEDFIDDDELNWVLNDDKACMIMWCYIREHKSRLSNDRVNRGDYTYDSMGIEESPTTTKKRYNCIAEFIDNSPLRKHSKLKIIKQARDVVYKVKSLSKKTSWIVKGDDKSVDWAWEYIIKNETTPFYLKPINISERYLSIYAFLFSRERSDAERELFLLKMSNAWRQAQYRASNSDNKLINTYISNESKEMLDTLVKNSDITIKKLLETLIKSEHDRLFGK